MLPRCSQRDSLSEVSNYSPPHVQPVRQVHIVCPKHCSSSAEPPGSFPENSVQTDSPLHFNVPPTLFTSFSSPPSRSLSLTSSLSLHFVFVLFQPTSLDLPLMPTTPSGISVVAPLPLIFPQPLIFSPSMASVNPVGVAQALRVQTVMSMLACQAQDAPKFDTSKPQELKNDTSQNWKFIYVPLVLAMIRTGRLMPSDIWISTIMIFGAKFQNLVLVFHEYNLKMQSTNYIRVHKTLITIHYQI